MPTRKVFIALPVHDGSVRVGTFTSMIGELSALTAKGFDVGVYCWIGDSLLPHARNVLLGQFMASDCTDLVFIDSDISWAPGTLVQLLDHEVDFVAGAYRFKSDDEGYPINWLSDDRQVDARGLIEVAGVPAGFLRMTRAGLERVIAKHQHLAYEPHTAKGLTCWYLFDIRFEHGRAWGEDYVFCNIVRDMGEKIWLDPGLKLGHTGAKEYRGTLSVHLAEQKRRALPEDERKQQEEKLIAFANSLLTPEMDKLFKQALGEAA